MEDYIKIDNEITEIIKSIRWLTAIEEKTSFLQDICEGITNDHKTYIKEHKATYDSVIEMNRLFNVN